MTTKSSRLTPEFEIELRKLCSLEMKTALAEIDALRAENKAMEDDIALLKNDLVAATESPMARCHIAGHRDEIERLREALDKATKIIEKYTEGCKHEKNPKGQCYVYGCDEAREFLQSHAQAEKKP